MKKTTIANYEKAMELLNILNVVKDKENYDYFKKVVTKKLQSLIQKNNSILTVKDENGRNIGMLAARKQLESVVYLALDNKEAGFQQDNFGKNIGMYSAAMGLEESAWKAFKNEKEAIANGRLTQPQKDRYNHTIEYYAERLASKNI